MTPTLTVGLPSFGAALDGDWRRLLDLARAAEAAGVDRVVLPDHVVTGPHTDEYQWGPFPQPPDAPWLEPLTVLTAIATVTETLRLTTGILITPLRPAVLLAKTVATLDQLSGGRVDLGVGTGWLRDEFDAEGLDHAARGQLLTDGIAACRALWEGTPATLATPTVTLDRILCAPRPAQARIPVLFSGVLHRRNVRRIVELGDGWIPIMGATVDDIAAGTALLRAELAVAGRDPATLQVRAPAVVARDAAGGIDLGATMASVPALVEAGAPEIRSDLRHAAPDLSDPEAGYARLVTAFRAAL